MNMMDITYTRHDIKEVAERLAAMMTDYRVLTLEGDLGAGKTSLISALCKTWGVIDPVSSPTYSLINQYEAKSLPVGHSIYHLDLYRLQSAIEAIDAGMEDILFSGEFCLVEWPSRAREIIPGRRLEALLSVVSDDVRHLTVISHEK